MKICTGIHLSSYTSPINRLRVSKANNSTQKACCFDRNRTFKNEDSLKMMNLARLSPYWAAEIPGPARPDRAGAGRGLVGPGHALRYVGLNVTVFVHNERGLACRYTMLLKRCNVPAPDQPRTTTIMSTLEIFATLWHPRCHHGWYRGT